MQREASSHINGKEKVLSKSSPELRLEQKDVGDLDKVLREYYLSQVNKIQPRGDRKRGRKLLENHLVLPKSRQRTSKDAPYINETLSIEDPLLVKLEEYRLIRRLNKSGRNPIYEISHDSLVEPILAERRNREAVMRFIKKYGKWFLLLLLILFAGGMIFENVFNVMDDKYALWPNSHGRHKSVSLDAANHIYAGPGKSRATIEVPFGQIENCFGSDSLTLNIGVDVTGSTNFTSRGLGAADTLAVDMGVVNLPITADQAQALIDAQRDTALPISITAPIQNNASLNPLLANVQGTALLKLHCEDPADAANSRGLGPAQEKKKLVKKDFGTLTVQASNDHQTIQLDTVIDLADLLTHDKVAYDILRDHKLHLTYEVAVHPVPEVAPTTVVEYVPVSGIEVLYADGSKRMISPETGETQRTIPPATHTVQAGENLYQISIRHSVSMDELRKLNNLSSDALKVGQVLKLR
jgi:LysM repeat protein